MMENAELLSDFIPKTYSTIGVVRDFLFIFLQLPEMQSSRFSSCIYISIVT